MESMYSCKLKMPTEFTDVNAKSMEYDGSGFFGKFCGKIWDIISGSCAMGIGTFMMIPAAIVAMPIPIAGIASISPSTAARALDKCDILGGGSVFTWGFKKLFR